jgi:hypothetical protein
MWTCPKCGEQVEWEFEVCWACGTSVDGKEDPNFFDTAGERECEENQPLPEGVRPEELVTVARCSLPVEAHALKLRLETAGIPVYLADEFTVTMDWLLSNAIGGIKVQVSRAEAERASLIVEEENTRRMREAENREEEEQEGE